MADNVYLPSAAAKNSVPDLGLGTLGTCAGASSKVNIFFYILRLYVILVTVCRYYNCASLY